MSIVIVFFSSYRFLGRQRIGSVKVQVKLKCNARGYYTTPHEKWGIPDPSMTGDEA